MIWLKQVTDFIVILGVQSHPPNNVFQHPRYRNLNNFKKFAWITTKLHAVVIWTLLITTILNIVRYDNALWFC